MFFTFIKDFDNFDREKKSIILKSETLWSTN